MASWLGVWYQTETYLRAEVRCLDRQSTIVGLADELRGFAELIRCLDRYEWATPTRCEGWTVADVGAHVAGQLSDIVAGRLEGLGTAEVTDRQVAERHGLAPEAVAGEIDESGAAVIGLLEQFDDEAWTAPSPAGGVGTLGEAIDGLWCDAYVHADDIRAATRRPPARGNGLETSVRHLADLLATRGWGTVILRLDGIPEIPVGRRARYPMKVDRTVTGDPLQFVLVATGRADPASMGLDDSVNTYR